MSNFDILNVHCTGPNRECRAHAKAGKRVHLIPSMSVREQYGSLVLPSYHFATIEEGAAYIDNAVKTAPLVETDEDLYRFREQNIAHRLPKGWVDPSRRR